MLVRATTGQSDGDSIVHAGLYSNSDGAILTQSEHIENWASRHNAGQNLVNQAEAGCLSESDVEVAIQREVETLLEIEFLADQITAKHAVNQIEIEAKRRALNTLKGIPAWERDSLFDLLQSIERDQLEINDRLYAQTARPACGASWSSRARPGLASGR